MADELDAMLQGSDQVPASQGQIDDQDTDAGQGKNPAAQQNPEEIEFNSLSGSTQDRIRRLAREKRELSERLVNLERLAGNGSQVPPAPGSNFQTPDITNAVQRLSDVGIATDEKVERKLDEKLNLLRWETEQQRLESKYTGANSEPSYVREEVEEFISSHPQYRGYAAEDVFRDHMFRSEFHNLDLTKQGSRTGQSTTLRPTKAQVRDDTLTPEFIADRTDLKKYPDALEWQEAHRSQIDKVLSQMQG